MRQSCTCLCVDGPERLSQKRRLDTDELSLLLQIASFALGLTAESRNNTRTQQTEVARSNPGRVEALPGVTSWRETLPSP